MKSKIIKRILIPISVIALLVAVSVIGYNAYLHDFSKSLPDNFNASVYIPDGMSDRFEGVNMVSTNEWHMVWLYKLNGKESEMLDKDLTNGIWKLLSSDELDYVNEVYFGDLKIDCDGSDEVYYSLYDCNENKFIAVDISDMILYGERQILFVCNKTHGNYYCVNKGCQA